MTRLMIDAALPAKPTQVIEPVELCAADGRVLGRYYPQLDPSEYDLEPRISREEFQRRKTSGEKTYTTAEVLAHLEQL